MMSCFSLRAWKFHCLYISLAALSDDQIDVIVLQFVDNNPDIAAE